MNLRHLAGIQGRATHFLIVMNRIMWHDRFRVIYYNTVIKAMKKLLFLLVIVTLIAGCSRTKAIDFCEGITPENKGVNCGSTFEEGELLAVISAKDPFGVNAITVQVQEVRNGKKEQVESITVDVKPDRDTATVNLSLYSGGTYVVRAMKKDEMIGEGEIVIREK
jgi:hypothetical protein